MESLKKEKEKLLKALEYSLRLVTKSKDLTSSDVMQDIVKEFQKIGLLKNFTDFANYSQTDEEWNALCKWYLLFDGPKASQLSELLFCFPGGAAFLNLDVSIIRHPNGCVTCLTTDVDKFGAPPKKLEYKGTTPATLARYKILASSLLEKKGAIYDPPQYALWTELIKLIDKDLASLSHLNISSHDYAAGVLFKSWRTYWSKVAFKIFAKFTNVLDEVTKDILLLGFETTSQIEESMLLSALCSLAQHDIPDLDADQAKTVKAYREACDIFFKRAQGLFFQYVRRLATQRLQNSELSSEMLRHYNKKVKACLEMVKTFAPKENVGAVQIATKFALLEEPVPTFQEVWERWLQLNGTPEALNYLMTILCGFIENSQNPYYPLLQECDHKLQQILKIESTPLTKWKEQKASQLNDDLIAMVWGLLDKPSPFDFSPRELEAFIKKLKMFPESCEIFRNRLLKFLDKTFQGEPHLTLYLAHLLKTFDDTSCTTKFIEKVLSSSPTMKVLKGILEVIGSACSKIPACQELLKKWILDHVKAEFPSLMIDADLDIVVEKGCKEHREEIFYAIDAYILPKIRQLLSGTSESPVGAHQMEAFLKEMSYSVFPFSIRGNEEYLKLLEPFHSDAWNPAVWVLLRTWGPEEITQKWRLAWLRQLIEQRQMLCPPQEVLMHHGLEEGYFRLRALFGTERLPEALNLFKKCCEEAKRQPKEQDTLPLMQLWQHMQLLLPVTDQPPENLNNREEVAYYSYSDLVGKFKGSIAPLLEKSKQFRKQLDEKKME